MKFLANSFLWFIVAITLSISLIEAALCEDLKLLELSILVLASLVCFVNYKKITLDRADINIIFFLVSLNLIFLYIEAKGLIYFKPTFILLLSILLSKLILPYMTIKEYMKKINLIYVIILIGLIIEYILMVSVGESLIKDTFECNGEVTGVRGYIAQLNIAKYILPFHVTGLNSIMLGTQTADQLSIIISIWFFSKLNLTGKKIYKAAAYLGVILLFLSPSITSLMIFIIVVFIMYFKSGIKNWNEPVKGFGKFYVFIAIALTGLFLFIQVLTAKYYSLDYVYQTYVLEQINGFGFFSINEILFGLTVERELELFGVGEIAFLAHLVKYGLIGFVLFYGSILFYALRALIKSKKSILLNANIFILFLMVIGNFHYAVMLGNGVMELFILHFVFVIYLGSPQRKIILEKGV